VFELWTPHRVRADRKRESKRTDSILEVARHRPPSTRPLWPLFTGVRGSRILRVEFYFHLTEFSEVRQ
jgi:hypothetical protein